MKTKQEQKPKEVVEPKQMKSRRVITLLYNRCPLCHLKLTKSQALQKDDTGKKQFFQLVQFGTNPDGTGYESYKCDYCERFIMVIIGTEPIVAKYDFENPNAKKKKPTNPFEAIFGNMGGNGV